MSLPTTCERLKRQAISTWTNATHHHPDASRCSPTVVLAVYSPGLNLSCEIDVAKHGSGSRFARLADASCCQGRAGPFRLGGNDQCRAMTGRLRPIPALSCWCPLGLKCHRLPCVPSSSLIYLALLRGIRAIAHCLHTVGSHVQSLLHHHRSVRENSRNPSGICASTLPTHSGHAVFSAIASA